MGWICWIRYIRHLKYTFKLTMIATWQFSARFQHNLLLCVQSIHPPKSFSVTIRTVQIEVNLELVFIVNSCFYHERVNRSKTIFRHVGSVRDIF